MERMMDKALVIEVVRGSRVVARRVLDAGNAHVQLTYEFVKLGEVSHDLSWGRRGLDVHPEEGTPFSELLSLAGSRADEVRVSPVNPCKAIELTWYSLNDENPHLTMEPLTMRSDGAIFLRGRCVFADGGKRCVGRLSKAWYWRANGCAYSDLMILPDCGDGRLAA
jgi:hypothetical protein